MMKVTREEFLGSDAEETMDVLRARVELFDEVIQFLRDENAKLREQGARLFDKMLELGTENAKLRELLRDAAIELYVNGNVTDGATELLFDQMRELGIEVE